MQINVKIHEDGKHFTLNEPVFYATNRGDLIVVPQGFTTDMASVPRLLWSIYPPTGRYQYAAVIHDWLYDCHRANRSPLWYSTPEDKRLDLLTPPYNSRQVCDYIFLEAMRASGVSLRTRYTLYSAVRLFANYAWNSK